jgi:hypothetical protein
MKIHKETWRDDLKAILIMLAIVIAVFGAGYMAGAR